VKKIKITMRANTAAEATKTDPLSPTEGTGRPRRQAALSTPGTAPPAAAGSSGGGTAAAAGGAASSKASKGSADKASAAERQIKSPGSAEKAQRVAQAQVRTQVAVATALGRTMLTGFGFGRVSTLGPVCIPWVLCCMRLLPV
jgi:hypothetical protein